MFREVVEMSMPLEGIRILDCTVWQQGPVSTAMMGDLGAEVIKIEDRGSGEPARGVMARLPDGRRMPSMLGRSYRKIDPIR